MVIYISDEDEDIGDVVDITSNFWGLVHAIHTTPFDEIREMGIYRAVTRFIDPELSYQVYVFEDEKYLEYKTIENVFDGVACYYRQYLPDTERGRLLSHAMEIIRLHVELDRQIDDVAMQLERI